MNRRKLCIRCTDKGHKYEPAVRCVNRLQLLIGNGDKTVTYGMSELYEKESENQEISGFGMEFTFKLKKDDYEEF